VLPVKVTHFAHAKDSRILRTQELTWDQFAAQLSTHSQSYQSKLTVPAFCPCEFRDPSLPRSSKNATRAHFLVLDLDKINAQQLADTLARLEGLNALLYTTWSHPKTIQDGLWSVRICVELSHPVEKVDWPHFWLAAVTRFGLTADPACKNIDRIYFGPAVPPGTDPSHCEIIRFRGRALVPEAVPAPIAPAKLDPITRDRLEKLAKRWHRSKEEHRSDLGDKLLKVCRGEAFAEAGNVDNTIYQLVQDINEALPNGDPATIGKHFAQSLQLMGYGGKMPHTVDDVTRKLERAQEQATQELATLAQEEATNRKLRIRQAFAHVDPTRDHPYTEAELEHYANKAKCSRDEFRKRWIIQRGPVFYLFSAGSYSAPYTKDDILNAALRDLAPACSAGVDLYTVAETGLPFRKTIAMLMSDYGSVANDYVLDLREQEAIYYAHTRTFVEAPAPLRRLEPTYSEMVAQWLEVMCGPSLPDVLKWIALVTSLDEICAALMLTGGPGTGKTLLAQGLSRLWSTEQPTDLESALGTFNSALSKCPLVFADEQIPKDFRGHARTAELRQFIAATSRAYRRKFAHETKILGAIRLLIAANNEEILAIQENLSTNDIEAIGDRFYHVRVNPDAAQFLALCDTNHMVAGDAIAKHALWLRDNHPVQRQGRFLIRSPDREFYRSLTTRSGIRSAVCQWCVGYLKDPRRIDASGRYLARVKRGRLLINVQALMGEAWNVYVTNDMQPPTGRLTTALAGLSTSRTSATHPRTGGIMHYRVIDTEHLLAWVKETEFATPEEIVSALATETEERASTAGVFSAAASRMN
jgi:hypothetical protein